MSLDGVLRYADGSLLGEMMHTIKSTFFRLTSLTALALAGCVAAPPGPECTSSHVRVIEAVLREHDLRTFGAVFFDRPEVVVIWEGARTKARSCRADGLTFTVASTPMLARSPEQYVLVTKLYHDETAAFVELMLPPSGKTGDFFLRNTGGWKVTQKKMGEH